LPKAVARALASAVRRREKADADMRRLIVEAHEAGGSLREIAAVTKLSHAGVRKILAAERN
jgi:hypothetical protein